MSKKKIKVGFTPGQHMIVHQFLNFVRPRVEKELGQPVQVEVNWSPVEGEPHIKFTGSSGLEKIIPINAVLEADDARVLAPLRVVKGGQGEH